MTCVFYYLPPTYLGCCEIRHIVLLASADVPPANNIDLQNPQIVYTITFRGLNKLIFTLP